MLCIVDQKVRDADRSISRKVGSKRWQVILSFRSYLRLLLSDVGLCVRMYLYFFVGIQL